MSELRRTIQELIRQQVPITVKRGRVTAFDTTKDTCTIIPNDGGAEYTDVKLRAIENETAANNRCVVYPKVGTYVLFAAVQNSQLDAFVCGVSEIDSIMIQIPTGLKIHIKSDNTVNVDATRVIFNGGTFGGVPKVNEVVSKLNAIENKLNQLISTINLWTPVPSDGGAALKALLIAWASTTLTLTTATVVQNTKVTH